MEYGTVYAKTQLIDFENAIQVCTYLLIMLTLLASICTVQMYSNINICKYL